MLWAPGVTLCDGIAYEYAQGNKVPMPDHDFEQDIIACAQNISKRYMGSKKRGETLEKIVPFAPYPLSGTGWTAVCICGWRPYFMTAGSTSVW